MKRVFGGRTEEEEEGPSARRPESFRDGDGDVAPTESTRLLPNRIDSDVRAGYLSPDDPAVTPYNLWTVRFTRYLTVFFTLVTFVWWTLLLISLFITPPGMSTRGSGFYGFSYATVALTTLIVQLLFFAVPSKAARILAAVMSVLLLADMIIVLAVPKIRLEEAWTGIASVVWALLVSIWTLIADRTVKWGKAEEEERLTGRQEERRTLLEWVEVLLSTIFLTLLAIIAFLLTCTLIQRALDARVTPPGELYWVDGDKYQIHLYCHGNATDAKGMTLPTVLFEGGEDPVEYGLWRFAENAVANGSFSRYCFADRPGLAWVRVFLSIAPLTTDKSCTKLTIFAERYSTVTILCQPGYRGAQRSSCSRRRGRALGLGECRYWVDLFEGLQFAPRKRCQGIGDARPAPRRPSRQSRPARPRLYALAARHHLATGPRQTPRSPIQGP